MDSTRNTPQNGLDNHKHHHGTVLDAVVGSKGIKLAPLAPKSSRRAAKIALNPDHGNNVPSGKSKFPSKGQKMVVSKDIQNLSGEREHCDNQSVYIRNRRVAGVLKQVQMDKIAHQANDDSSKEELSKTKHHEEDIGCNKSFEASQFSKVDGRHCSFERKVR